MKRTDKSFYVVGVGASAGGLEALINLVGGVPQEIDMAFVIVQHLEPRHRSMLTGILSKHSALPVIEAENNMPLKKSHIYVIPPNSNISVVDGRLKITKRGRDFDVNHMPINSFFMSLAKEKMKKAIGILLSGTGTDGTEGIRAIKTKEGLTFAQNEATASYYAMPFSAIQTGCVDFVLAPIDMARKLYAISTNSSERLRRGPAETKDYLERIFSLLKLTTGVDFTNYRRTTILRRLDRRVSHYRLSNYQKYYDKLLKDTSEVNTLFKEFLISVTSFFRDPGSFAALKRKILPELIKNRPLKEPIRVWVPGCSTGQEVYSLAVTIYEFLQKMGLRIPLQMFGTDLNDSLIDKARSGLYTADSVDNVPRNYLEKYFTRIGEDNYRINKNIRDLCIFAKHNVIIDPPLSRMDIISFKNVMIYLEPYLQKRVINMLLYALKPSGFIILGMSETLGNFPESFRMADKRNKIYSKIVSGKRARLDIETTSELRNIKELKGAETMVKPVKSQAEFEREVDKIYLSKYKQAGVLVNEAMEVIQARGDTSLYVKLTTGKASLNILNVVREELKAELYEAIQKVKRNSRPERKEGIPIAFLDEFFDINFEVTPVLIAKERYFLILFEQTRKIPQQASLAGAQTSGGKTGGGKETARLKRELQSTKVFLHSVIAEKDKNNEELINAIEEIQSSNEELQTMNEEIQTGKEELESSNEELVTLNDELQNRNMELLQANGDLNNLISNINVPVVILARDLKIRRLTPLAKNVMNVVQSDIGRQISQIKLKIDIPDLEKLINSVIKNSKTIEKEARDVNDRWYSVRISPYFSHENKNDGVVLAFIDIGVLKRIQETLRGTLAYSNGIVETINEPLVVLDQDMRIVSANANFYKTFHVKRPETEYKSIFKIGNGQWNIPGLRRLLEGILPHKTSFNNFEVTRNFPRIGPRTVILNGREIINKADNSKLILLAMLDVTKVVVLQKDKETLSRIVEERTREALNSREQVNKMKHLAEVGELAATVAHELRNPLSSINVAAYNIKRKMANPGLNNHFDNITKKITEGTAIINNLLAFSKIKEPHYERIRIYDVIMDSIEHERQKCKSPNISFVDSFEPLKDVEMDADPLQIGQLIINILDNACDALREKGAINIIGESDRKYVKLTVRDNGMGIARENLDKVFKPFFSTKAKGTGLGLAICWQIVHLHSGSLKIKSRKGEGTRVIITLPLKKPKITK
jgi:two-component system, chemotaxis family, CheB/CheR fusion protein